MEQSTQGPLEGRLEGLAVKAVPTNLPCPSFALLLSQQSSCLLPVVVRVIYEKI